MHNLLYFIDAQLIISYENMCGLVNYINYVQLHNIQNTELITITQYKE